MKVDAVQCPRGLARRLLALGCPSSELGHVGLDAGLVDENQLARINLLLMALQAYQ